MAFMALQLLREDGAWYVACDACWLPTCSASTIGLNCVRGATTCEIVAVILYAWCCRTLIIERALMNQGLAGFRNPRKPPGRSDAQRSDE